jgi:hypothetical protein
MITDKLRPFDGTANVYSTIAGEVSKKFSQGMGIRELRKRITSRVQLRQIQGMSIKKNIGA